MLEQEKAKIRKEYERREGQVDVKKKMCVRWNSTRRQTCNLQTPGVLACDVSCITVRHAQQQHVSDPLHDAALQ